MAERIQKILANFGVASRRKAEELITDGRVTVNGKIPKLGDKCDVELDIILVDNLPLRPLGKKVYYLLNKPIGYISAAKDDRGRKTVLDLIPTNVRIYPVGRLDMDTEGLIILTNDGELTHRLIHPKFEIEKTYIASVKGDFTYEKQKLLEAGIVLEDGKTAPAKVKILKDGKIKITIHEGKNREIRRMFKALSCLVTALKRVKFGEISLKDLPVGKFRELTANEVEKLYALTENFDNRGRPRRNDGGDNGGKRRRRGYATGKNAGRWKKTLHHGERAL